jgi:hypothetical protein
LLTICPPVPLPCSYCLPNGEYYIELDDAALYAETRQRAAVTFSSATDAGFLALAGVSGVLSGAVSWGQAEETWYEVGTLSAPAGGGGFGWAVSGSGGLLAVGAPQCVAPCSAGGTVSVYEGSSLLQTVSSSSERAAGAGRLRMLFTISLTVDIYTFHSLPQIVSPDYTTTQEFGYAVSLSRYYLVIGSPGDAMMGADSGMVYIYALGADAAGGFEAAFSASFMPGMDTAGARYGTSVAIYDGSADVNVPESALSEWVAVGAPGRNVSGMVSVYAKVEGAAWALVGSLGAPPAAAASGFGQSVAWYNDFLVSIASLHFLQQ